MKGNSQMQTLSLKNLVQYNKVTRITPNNNCTTSIKSFTIGHMTKEGI